MAESNALAKGEVEKVLDIPALDMSDDAPASDEVPTPQADEGATATPKPRRRTPRANVDAPNTAPKRRGRPPGSKNRPRDEGARASSPRGRTNDPVEHALLDLVANVQALARQMKSQGNEVRDLRKRLDAVKKHLG
jgi:hypothetical protein